MILAHAKNLVHELLLESDVPEDPGVASILAALLSGATARGVPRADLLAPAGAGDHRDAAGQRADRPGRSRVHLPGRGPHRCEHRPGDPGDSGRQGPAGNGRAVGRPGAVPGSTDVAGPPCVGACPGVQRFLAGAPQQQTGGDRRRGRGVPRRRDPPPRGDDHIAARRRRFAAGPELRGAGRSRCARRNC